MQVKKHYYFNYQLIVVITSVIIAIWQVAFQRYLAAFLWLGIFGSYLLTRTGLTLSSDKFAYKPTPVRKRLFYPTDEIQAVRFVNNEIQVVMKNEKSLTLYRSLFSREDLENIDEYFLQFVKN